MNILIGSPKPESLLFALNFEWPMEPYQKFAIMSPLTFLSTFIMIYSVHEVCMSAMGSSWKYQNTRVLVLQKCALRIKVFSHPLTPSSPLFRYFEILTIFDLVKLLVHQYLNSLLPSDLCSTLVFKRIDHSYSTRRQNLRLLKLPHAYTSAHGLKRLSNQAILQ